MRAKAIYACIAENPGEITFDASDTLTNISDSAEDGWLTGTVGRTGDRGLFPVVYTELQPETGDDLQFLQRLQAKGLLSSTIKLEQFAQSVPPPVPVKSPAVLARTSSAARVAASGSRAAPPPPRPRPRPPVSAKPSVRKTGGEVRPLLPPKPAVVGVGGSDENAEARMQREREEALDWEARHGIKRAPAPSAGQTAARPPRPPVSAKPQQRPPAKATVAGTKPVFAAGTSPGLSVGTSPAFAAGTKPALPPRTPSSASLSSVGTRGPTIQAASLSTYHPATENDAPALPFNAGRQMGVERASLVAPVVENIQPLPRSLISKMNNMGFEDSFEPGKRGIASQPASDLASSTSPPVLMTSPASVSGSSSASSTQSAGIPLTSARHVQGGGNRPAVPAAKRQLSYVSRQPVLTRDHPGYKLPGGTSASSTGRPMATGMTTPPGTKSDRIPPDALQRYSHLFKRLDKEAGRKGYLSSDQVHAVVVRCRLPEDQMRRIWDLSDRNRNGRFGPSEFNIIMYLTDCALRRDPIPDTLSVDLLHSAGQPPYSA
ncbi:hypothetical protein LPJ56_005098 [Coemansia sp. RSA 2599]|nr:hypothetical protein LPJ75_005019 [Coemansia sp. RSA 2598]KAJ1813655.1 hypothetical protein LPJ56_005098 [Coemansia sp. RSA 2599]